MFAKTDGNIVLNLSGTHDVTCPNRFSMFRVYLCRTIRGKYWINLAKSI